MKDNYCVIMGGGIGSRFWPFSRTNRPKQFLDFLGVGRTLLQQTFDRFNQILPAENIYIVTNALYRDLVKEQLPELSDSQILLEPQRKNTAPCIEFASLRIKAVNPKANIVVAPSDHVILKEREFLDSVIKALDFVKSEPALVTLGITPTRPETGYGYIQKDECVKGDFQKVKTFTEKPDLELAKVFCSSGEFLWNAGIFVWNVDTILEAFSRFQPEIDQILSADISVYNTDAEDRYIARQFPLCPSVSIDYGVMERADNVYVLSTEVGWSDLGTWGSLYDYSSKTDEGNVSLHCKLASYDSHDNIVVLPEGKLAVIQGLDDYIVVESDNVLLICKKDQEQRIRQFVTDTELNHGDSYI